MVKDLSLPSSPLPGSKRFRTPRILENDPAAFEETLQLTDSDTSDSEVAGAAGLRVPSSKDDLLPDDLSKDLAELHQLRKNVKKNLKLRPIRSRSNLPKVSLRLADDSPFASSYTDDPKSATSPTSAISSYFTPVDVTPFTAVFSANSINPPASHFPHPPPPISARTLSERLSALKRPLLIDTRVVATYQSIHLRHSVNIAIPSLILKRCRKPGGGLQSIDTLRQFITTNKAIKRWDSLMGPGGPWDGDVVVYDDEMSPRDKDSTAWAIIPVIQQLLTFGTISYLEGGISHAGHDPYLRKLIIHGDEEDKIPDETGPSLLKLDSTAVQPATGGTRINRKASFGLSQLDTNAALRSKKLPEIEPSSTTSTNPPSPLPTMTARNYSSSSQPSRGTSNAESSFLDLNSSAATPSPPPSAVGFRKPHSPRRPSVPNLRRLDTKSAERLRDVPKLSLRTKPMRSATLAVPPSLSINISSPHSPTHLNLRYSNHAPPSARLGENNPFSPSDDPANYLTPYYTPPHTPRLPIPPDPPRTPLTARPEAEPPTTDDAFPVFTISTILPNFLFLGPEMTTHEHVEELKQLGVKRILNIAAECDDDNGLQLREVFEKYNKIPMRDTVEEDNIAMGVREVCDILGKLYAGAFSCIISQLFLDDARLHSAPTYVHCKAGKSRSVTAVIAYLIHANHWTLSQAYSFVVERRKGISPNIGFVSELMNFEEQELGGKSIGVQPALGSGGLNSGSSTFNQKLGEPSDSNNDANNDGSTFGLTEPSYPISSHTGTNHHHRRAGHHIRESLPPQLGTEGLGMVGGPMSALETQTRALLGDSAHETEVKDASGRYRHARRAPVDEMTLQPMRRASKAGLESSMATS